MIEAVSISKNFGQQKVLNNISFKIEKGEIVGFLGRNGAGKTTLMRILTTYLKPTEGHASIMGMHTNKDSLAVRKKIGYLPENPPLYNNMTVFDYLKFAGRLKDISARQIRVAVDRVLGECHLRDVQNKPISVLSKGYKQRVGIAQAIIHRPEVLILDEPTSGLDPIQIDKVRELIRALENKTTVILSTHILSEIEQLAKRVLIIKSGEIITDSSLEDLLEDKDSKKEITLESAFLRLHENDG